MMKTVSIFLWLSIVSMNALSQVDSVGKVDEPTNSFGEALAAKHPGLKYAYDEVRQIHNYSGNWDLDGDQKADDVLFIGDGGAHLYFHLQLKLTSESSVRDYPYIHSDMPFLETVDFLTADTESFRGIVVHDFNNDGIIDLLVRNDGYIRTDGSYEAPKALKSKGVSSKDVVFCIERKKLVIKDWSQLKLGQR